MKMGFREWSFIGVFVLATLCVVFGKLHGDMPLWFHIPYQLLMMFLAFVLLRPWGIGLEFFNQFIKSCAG